MTKQVALLTATLALSTLLSACGTTLPASQMMRPMQAPMMQRPVQMQRAQVRTQPRTGEMQAKYTHLILETSYDPDLNGNHFGFDFGSVNFINHEGRTIELDLRYSRQGRVLWISLIERGAPQEARENVDQSNRARLAEVARELRSLFPGTPQQQADIARIASLLENPPVRP